TTDGSCSATINATLPVNVGGETITATATDPDGNTSEFSQFITGSGDAPAPEGSLDTSFDPGTGADFTVLTTAVQSDGKIIIGGLNTGGIARLNSDGSRDTSFDPGTGADFTVFTTALQSDGKIIIGGKFLNYGLTPRSHIARLNSDGSLDTSFDPG